MSNTPQVVDGEASESDSEIEIGITPDTVNAHGANLQASVISGEASESEDEGRVSPPVQSVPAPAPPPQSPSHPNMYSNSILHNRLWEVNVSMRKNVEALALHTMRLAHDKMASLDRELLALQESVRFADSQVTLARARSRQIKEQLKNCHFQTALPTVRTEYHNTTQCDNEGCIA